MAATEHLQCPSCATAVSELTLKKFNGVCRRCYKQPIAYQKQWVFFAFLALLSPIAAVLLDQKIVALESNGGTERVHVLIAMTYRIAGRLGVIAFFFVTGSIWTVLCVQAYRRARSAKERSSIAKPTT